MIASRNPHNKYTCECFSVILFCVILGCFTCNLADVCCPEVAGIILVLILLYNYMVYTKYCNLEHHNFTTVKTSVSYTSSVLHGRLLIRYSVTSVRVSTFIRDGTRVHQIFYKLNGQRTFSLQLFSYASSLLVCSSIMPYNFIYTIIMLKQKKMLL